MPRGPHANASAGHDHADHAGRADVGHADHARTADASITPNADRARGPDRRLSVVDQRSTGLERRRGVGRRLSDFNKAAEEGNLTSEQFLFLMAIESFKKANGKIYPSWTDVLEVVRLLGYRKTMPMELTLTSAEDWRERADAPSNVRTQRQRERDAHARGREAA